MVDIRLFAFVVIGFAAGIYLFFQGLKWNKKKRLIQNISTSKVRSLAMGLVEVAGEVKPFKKTLKSPFRGLDCLFFSYRVQQYVQHGKSGSWVTKKRGKSYDEFYLEDETGKVLISPQRARVEIPEKTVYTSGFANDPPEVIIKSLAGMGMSHEGFLGINKKMRYIEKIITPKQKLYIMGYAGDNPHVGEGKGVKNEQDVMIQAKKGIDYFISDKSEKKLVSSLQWQALAGIFGGLGLVAVSLFIILLFLNLV